MRRLSSLVSFHTRFTSRQGSRFSLVPCKSYLTVFAPPQAKTVRVPVGGSGHVELQYEAYAEKISWSLIVTQHNTSSTIVTLSLSSNSHLPSFTNQPLLWPNTI